MSGGQPPPCRSCGLKPRAERWGRLCYDCLPGGPFVPPPCKKCGTTKNFYASDLCARCHPFGPHRLDSCRDCSAWGAKRSNKWLCRPCIAWTIKYPVGECLSCHQLVAVNGRDICRLCWRNASGARDNHGNFDPIAGNRDGQQLFFADLFKALRLDGSCRPVPLPVNLPLPVTYRQLVLFVWPHDLRGGTSKAPAPRDPHLFRAFEIFEREYATRHHWTRGYSTQVRGGIRVLLGLQDTAGATISIREAAVLTQLNWPVRSVCDVLAAAGFLEDDRIPALPLWFERQIDGLSEQMCSELRVWFDLLLNGSTTSPRRRPRSETTVRLYVTWALPALRHWTDNDVQSLRAISRSDLIEILPAEGVARATTCRALRSIFHILKGRKMVFADPTARMHTWIDSGRQPLPLDTAVILDALNSTNPARAAMAALVAFHGLATADLCALQLTDIRDGRLHLGRRAILIAHPVHDRLTTYLEYRNNRWPNTNNTHFFIHVRTGYRTEPVGNRWIKLTMALPGGTRALRTDRILHEAHATGGDARRLCDLFGLGINAANRYTATVDHPDLVAPKDR
jgi:hypothetical protein